MNLTLMTDNEILKLLASRAKEVRIVNDMRQSDLSERSAVPLSAIRVFERGGSISLAYLLKILRTLSLVEELDNLFRQPEISDLKELVKQKSKTRKRVRK
jgi:transcriptional regulator with XRE-family HTH domain